MITRDLSRTAPQNTSNDRRLIDKRQDNGQRGVKKLSVVSSKPNEYIGSSLAFKVLFTTRLKRILNKIGWRMTN